MQTLAEYGLGRREVALLRRRRTCVLYVIGDTDTGKTTFAAACARLLAGEFRTAVVDLDAGQASIGLPTTFAWRLCGRQGLTRGRPDGMYFAGTTSPTGFFEYAVAGAAAMVREARGRAEKVVVDTCGLARGRAGRDFHHVTLEAVRPDVVMGLERAEELSEVLEPLVRSGWPAVVRAGVPDGVRRRSQARRRRYRCERFRAYFERAREVKLPLDEVAILRPKPDPVRRIASLRDGRGRDLALGIVLKFDAPRGTVTVLSPIPARRKVAAIVLGSMRIARDGRQLARNV